MAEVGRYEKRPRPEHRSFLLEGLRRSRTVSSVEVIDDFNFVVDRYDKSPIQIYLTNKYILSLADAMEILTDSPATTCIVSTMNYNQYSPEAKVYCRERGVGLFLTKELFGAVYYNGDQFLDYVPPR